MEPISCRMKTLERPMFTLNSRRTLSQIHVRRGSGKLGAWKFVCERVSGKPPNMKVKHTKYLNAFHFLITEIWEVHLKTTSTENVVRFMLWRPFLFRIFALLAFRIAWSCTSFLHTSSLNSAYVHTAITLTLYDIMLCCTTSVCCLNHLYFLNCIFLSYWIVSHSSV